MTTNTSNVTLLVFATFCLALTAPSVFSQEEQSDKERADLVLKRPSPETALQPDADKLREQRLAFIARMSALRMKVRLDDREIWRADGYWRKARSPNDAYIEVLGDKYQPTSGVADE